MLNFDFALENMAFVGPPKALSDEQKEAAAGQRATITLRDGKQERAATAAENVTVKHW